MAREEDGRVGLESWFFLSMEKVKKPTVPLGVWAFTLLGVLGTMVGVCVIESSVGTPSDVLFGLISSSSGRGRLFFRLERGAGGASIRITGIAGSGP